MKKIIRLFILFHCIANSCLAQSKLYVEPMIGYQRAINNSNHPFQQINTALQFCWKTGRHYEMLFLLQKGWPIELKGTDAAYSTNPALPQQILAQKTFKPSSFSFALGHRIKLAGKKTSNSLFVVLYTGGTKQKIDVSYQYDKSNYTILNPDKTQERFSGFVSGGLEYMRQLKTGRIFLQAVIASEPLGKSIDYPSSFDFISPITINVGYSIPLTKK